MKPKLSELFPPVQGATIEWGGNTVQRMYEVAALDASAVLTITFIHASDARPQALRLKARFGRLEIAGQMVDDVVLWTATTPKSVVVAMRPAPKSKAMTVGLWNVWRDSIGAMQAWIGDAGIVVEEREDGCVVLHCSDGFGEPSFDDLVVELRVGKA